jgi:hypothetical protein
VHIFHVLGIPKNVKVGESWRQAQSGEPNLTRLLFPPDVLAKIKEVLRFALHFK